MNSGMPVCLFSHNLSGNSCKSALAQASAHHLICSVMTLVSSLPQTEDPPFVCAYESSVIGTERWQEALCMV